MHGVGGYAFVVTFPPRFTTKEEWPAECTPIVQERTFTELSSFAAELGVCHYFP